MKNYKPSYLFILKNRLRGLNWLAEFYFKNKKVLDIGCGEGEFLLLDKSNFHGIDTNQRVIDKLLTQGFQVKYGSATEINYPDNFFQGVYCHNVIEHLDIAKAHKLIAEAGRVLETGALFILASEVVTKKFWHTFGHAKPYPPEAVIKLLRADSREEFEGITCFEVMTTIYFGDYYKNKLLYFISTLIAYHLPFFRREYYLVLKKK